MAGAFKIKTLGFDEISRWLQHVSDNLTTKDLMQHIGAVAEAFTITRTLKGIDVDGNSFEIYSAEYARMKGVARNAVNLKSTGEMLASMVSVVNSDHTTVIVGFDPGFAKFKAIIHNNGKSSKHIPKREFMGLQDKELQVINQIILKHIESLIEGRF